MEQLECNGTVVAYFKCPGICLEESTKNMGAGRQTDIWIRNLMNKKQDCQSLNRDVQFISV